MTDPSPQTDLPGDPQPPARELHFRQLFDAMHEGMAVVEVITDDAGTPIDWRYLEVNRQTERYLQTPAAQIIGSTYRQTVPHPDPAWIELIGQVGLTGEPANAELFSPLHGRWMQVSAFSPRPGQTAFFYNDVTERRQAEAEIAAAHRQTAEILESISDAFYSLDRQQRFTYVNRRTLSLWKMGPEDLIGRGIWEVFPAGKETESYPRIQQALEDGQPADFETYSQYLRQWVEIHLYPTESGISVYFQDITERKRAEAALEQYTRELERSNRDLQDFATIASHDLQEPLRKIEVMSAMLASGAVGLSEKQQDLLHRMRSSATRMRNMINGMLEIARLSTRATPFEPVDLNRTLQEVLADLEMQIKQRGAAIEVTPLPPIQADPVQMRQLFQNLIANALKFQPPGGSPQVKIAALPASAPNCIQFIVQDNGIGFDTAYVEHIFQPFKRLVSRTAYEGSGIGLSIVRRVIEHHNGEIGVTSQPGAGTTFTITLPVEQNS